MSLIEVIGPDGLRELEELVDKKIHATGVTKEDWRILRNINNSTSKHWPGCKIDSGGRR